MGGMLDNDVSPKASVPETKLETKITEAMQMRETARSSMKSFHCIILKFPRIDESLRKFKATFEEFDEDGNSAIDAQELKNCFHKLKINFTNEEIDDLFEACDINKNMGMKFNEFIVLLCLVYPLKDDPTALHAISRKGMPDLEATLTLVDAFVFLDKNKDGYVSKNEMVDAINETAAGEQSSGRIGMKRFAEKPEDQNLQILVSDMIIWEYKF